MSGIVTLLTDFGTDDTFAGVMAGVLLGRAPQLRIVDLTHAIAPGDRLAAAFHLRTALPYFPDGTVHVVVVDPGVGSQRRILVARIGTQLVLAPDNGLLTPLLDADTAVRALENPALRLDPVSNTFHGRDLFAPAAAALATGLALDAVGPQVAPLRDDALWPRPRVHATGADGEVLHVDRFGNLISNLDAAALGDGPGGVAALAGQWRGPLTAAYAAVPPRETVAVVGSSGFLEIAVRDGSAAARYGVGRGAAIEWQRARPSGTRGA